MRLNFLMKINKAYDEKQTFWPFEIRLIINHDLVSA